MTISDAVLSDAGTLRRVDVVVPSEEAKKTILDDWDLDKARKVFVSVVVRYIQRAGESRS